MSFMKELDIKRQNIEFEIQHYTYLMRRTETESKRENYHQKIKELKERLYKCEICEK